jgi:hypothetical protein
MAPHPVGMIACRARRSLNLVCVSPRVKSDNSAAERNDESQAVSDLTRNVSFSLDLFLKLRPQGNGSNLCYKSFRIGTAVPEVCSKVQIDPNELLRLSAGVASSGSHTAGGE